MKTYLFTFIASMLLTMGVTPIVILLAHKYKLFDVPDARKMHNRPIARFGGVAVFVSMMCLVVPVLFLQNIIGQSFREVLPKIIVLLTGCTVMFLVGLIDDCKNLRARHKLLSQLAVAFLVCAFGIRIEALNVANLFTLNFGILSSWILTICWIIGITNAVNLTDGLDGLAAGISAITCAVIAILAVTTGEVIMAIIMLALLGSLIGFLFFNFNPAKVFLGDCGSQFIGFCLAASSVLCMTKTHALVGLALPFLALGIPIYDTFFSILRRFLQRRSIFAPDQAHFHHRLLTLGLHQKHAVITSYIITVVIAGLGMFMTLTRNIESLVLFICMLIVLLLVFRTVGAVRLREVIAGFKQKSLIEKQARTEIQNFENIQLQFQNVKTFHGWWETICTAAREMNFAWLFLTFTEDDGTVHKSLWQQKDFKPDPSCITLMTLPVHKENGSLIELELGIISDSSLESAGRRATLFSRLIDECNPALLQKQNRKVNIPKKRNKIIVTSKQSSLITES